jgi:exopolysaccharide production protein ExoQ
MQTIVKQILPYWIIYYFIGSALLPRYFTTLQFVSLYLLAGLILVLENKKVLTLLAKDHWLLALISLTGLSFFWSVVPRISFAHFRTSIVIFIISGYIVTTYTPKQIIDYMSKILGAIVLISLIYIVAIPEISVVRGAWKGVFPHQSYFAAVAGFAAISIFNSFILRNDKARGKYSKVLSITLVAACFMTIWYTGSRTPLLSLIASFAILPFFYLDKIKGLKARTQCFLVLIYILVIVIPLVFFLKDFIIVDLLGKSPNLSGRDEIWKYVGDKIAERPFLGYGSAAFWHNQQLSWEVRSKISFRTPDQFNTHSSYYDCLLGLGFIGFFLLIGTIIAAIRRNIILFYRHNQLEARWGLQIVVFMLFASYSDTWVGFLTRSLGWFLFNIISLMSICQLQKIKVNRIARIAKEGNPYLHKSVQSFSRAHPGAGGVR